jgi:peptidoglycan-associated lipoprotein
LGALLETLTTVVFSVNKTFLTLFLISLLVACASDAKPNKVLVEDKKGSPNYQKDQQLNSTLEPVNSLGNDNMSASPANVEKIIYFNYDSFIIRPEFQSTIEIHAKFLKLNSRAKVTIEGHDDGRVSSTEYSLSLGQKRAEMIRRSLIILGVDSSQIEVISFGSMKPAVKGSDESASSKNSRIEFSYK